MLLIAGTAVTAPAATVKNVTKYKGRDYKYVYNYKYYTRTHPAVVAEVGTDPNAVLEFFVQKGMPRGHQAISTFFVKDYYKQHPELHKLLGTGYRKYYKYYMLYGRFGDKSPEAKLGKKIFATRVCIDPGHQSRGNYSREQIGPGSSTYKPKVSSGTYGRWSRLNEYQVVLQIGLKLRAELQFRGYTVVMTRTKHAVNISNRERAQKANNEKCDMMIRLHCDGQEGGSYLHGVRAMTAGKGNRYIKAGVVTKGQKLGKLLAAGQAKATGQPVLSQIYTNEMSGINWAQMPCAIIEMGYMSNPSEDRNLANDKYQDKIAKGLSDGVDRYMGAPEKTK